MEDVMWSIISSIFLKDIQVKKMIENKKNIRAWVHGFNLTVVNWMEADLNANYHILIKNDKVKKNVIACMDQLFIIR